MLANEITKDDDQYLMQDKDCKDKLMYLMLQAIYTARARVLMMEEDRKAQRGKSGYKVSIVFSKIQNLYELLMRIYSNYHWQPPKNIADMTYLYERCLKISIDIKNYLKLLESLHENVEHRLHNSPQKVIAYKSNSL